MANDDDDEQHLQTTAARARVYSSAAPTKYAFSKVFPGDASLRKDAQADFYKETALPLVEELLQGQSGLIFTYGVTNSGKSYTVQGGNASNEAGVLPRSMDTIFNSIKGLESTSEVGLNPALKDILVLTFFLIQIRPVGLIGVELAKSDTTAISGINPFSIPGLSKKLPSSNPVTQYEHDATKVKVDRNYRYSVWVSYVEVYNEKIFDLLDAAPPASTTSRPSTFGGGFSRSESFRGSNWALASLTNDTGPIYLQRKPLTLKNDAESGGKYVAGLQEIRVHSIAEAREILQRGQENRQVFGTMANRASSRSHGVFTVKIIREHAGEKDFDVAFSTSRLSIVDLAGSERLGNTSVTGDRLKEAGSINKSLMCLGQCLETLRKNQTRAATFVPMPSPVSSIGNTSSINTAASKLLKRRPSIVPFRHSKLTELFQSFFTGEGRAVMIVNVNPFDTGFDENSHVMRFSAAAKEVQTIRTQATSTNLSRFVHPSLRDLFNPSASPAPSPAAKTPVMLPSASSRAIIPPRKESLKEVPVRREGAKKVLAPPPPPVVKPAEQEVTIIEENNEEEEEQSDSFVDHLMVKYEEVRHRLYESERQCALIEQRVREEMAEEMSRRLQEMENIFNCRIVQDATMHDDFVNRKLDLFTSSSSARRDEEEDSDDDDDDDAEVEKSLAITKKAAVNNVVEEDMDDSIVIMKTKRGSAKKTILSDSEEEDEDDVAEDGVDGTMDATADSVDASMIDAEQDETASADEEDQDDDDDEEESASSEDGEEQEEEASDSDCSFDATVDSVESLESSFEAAPRRTSRGRVSKAKVDKAPPKRPVKSASRVSPTKAAAPAVRKSANGLPLMERSANISIDDSQRSSDSSLILTNKKVKSPKKRK